MKSVCVFCGSSKGARSDYQIAATRTAEALVERGLTVVYGGGKVGLMGTVADRSLELGGRVHGVITQGLVDREVAHTGLADLQITETMHQRKQAMADQSDAFLALPGGFGTLEEVSEVLSWMQIGIHRKPLGFLNTCGYFDGLMTFFDSMVSEGFLSPTGRELALLDSDPADLLDRLARRAS